MCDTGYSVRNLVSDIQKLAARGADEREMLDKVPDLAKRLVLMKHNWLRDYMRESNPEPGSAGVYKLHEQPDHGLLVAVVTWLPGDETPPHDHGTWAVIAGLDGAEINHIWRRVDDGSRPGYAELERASRQAIDAATIVAMPGDAIHSVHNDSGAVSVTLHVYGRDVDYTDRSKFDPARHTVEPYRFGGTVHRVDSPTRT
jgi:predicted metal-dependent enzyme (double-stranded beta helix superfamily)